MVLQGIRVEEGKIHLDGYPEGSTVYGLAANDETTELSRLWVYRIDLNDIDQWMNAYQAPESGAKVKLAFAIAALVRFCCCFESTSGLRHKPLKPKKIFTLEQRDLLKKLQSIRNKIAAHDELLYRAIYPLLVVGTDAAAIEAVTVHLDTPFDIFPEFSQFHEMVRAALHWVEQDYERVARLVVEGFNSKPYAERLSLRQTVAPDFKIHITEPKDLL